MILAIIIQMWERLIWILSPDPDAFWSSTICSKHVLREISTLVQHQTSVCGRWIDIKPACSQIQPSKKIVFIWIFLFWYRLGCESVLSNFQVVMILNTDTRCAAHKKLSCCDILLFTLVGSRLIFLPPTRLNSRISQLEQLLISSATGASGFITPQELSETHDTFHPIKKYFFTSAILLFVKYFGVGYTTSIPNFIV